MFTHPVLPSHNRDLGFFGTITVSPLRDRPSDAVWALASTLIAEAVRAESEAERIGIRDFLDSLMGRHFADDVVGALHAGAGDSEAAILAAIRKWQRWRTSRATERKEGIPAGLPYLTGWVQHFAGVAAMTDAD
jgi:hypothetical protein